jgi:hypothetical protein
VGHGLVVVGSGVVVARASSSCFRMLVVQSM